MAQWLPDGPVTIVFSDVVGSTDLRTDRGDVAAHRLLRAHEEVVRRCLAAHQGREVKALGDGFMLAFASVRRALTCSIAIQQALAERNAETPGDEVLVRIGVNTGEVVVEGDDLYGQAVNAAARIAAAAGGGEVLVSDIVRQLAGTGSGVAFADAGERTLRGFPDPWRLYAATAEVRGAAAPTVGRTPFVGRQAERVELRRLLAQVQGGTGALVTIGGEPGVGKTRLAEELARRCEREGFLVYTGNCYEAAGAAPYIPIVEIYEQALAAAPSPQAFREFLGEEAPQVAKLVPRLRQLCTDIPAPIELPAEQERRFLFNSLWEVLARTARGRPTLLILDDIHWADEPTMLLIQHCAERAAQVPLLIVGLYRDSELDVGRPLSATFSELTRRRLAVRLSLHRLPAEAVAEMLAGLAGQPAPPALVETIYVETEGNPFFTEEVFKHLSEEGRLFDDAGLFRSDLTAADLDVPEGVRVVVGARLRRLSEEGPAVLGAAAVLGRVFDVDVLREVTELGEDRLLDLIEEAERAGLIAPLAGPDDQYRFAHELIRQTVLSAQSAPRRRRLHARVAEGLERRHSGALEPHAATIAHHLLESGASADPKRVFRYLAMAGAWAQGTAAFEEALVHLEHAAERADAATADEHIDLLYRLAIARQSTGRWAAGRDTWLQAVDLCEATGDAQRTVAICWEAAYNFGVAAQMADASAVARRGLAVVTDDRSADRARLLALVAVFSGMAGAVVFAEEEAMLAEALDIAEELGDPAARASCLESQALARWVWMQMAEGVAYGVQAMPALRELGDRWTEATVGGFTAFCLAGTGRPAEAVALADETIATSQQIGNALAEFLATRGRRLVEFMRTGDVPAFRAFADWDLAFNSDRGWPWSAHSHSYLAVADFLAGDWSSALEHARIGADTEPPGTQDGQCRSVLIEQLAYAGERAEVLALLETATMPVPAQANPWGSWALLRGAVEALHVLGEHERCGALYELMVECIERTGVVGDPYFDCRLLERVAGIAAHSARRYEDAERHFRTALRQATELPHVPEQAHTRRFFAAMLLDRGAPGDRAEGARLANEAVARYRRMGMPRHLELSQALPF